MSLLESILSSKLWAPAAVILPVLTYYLSTRYRVKREVAFGLYDFSMLLSPTLPDADKYKLFYNDKVLDNIIILKIRITNTGNKCICVSDYVRPIVFHFPDTLAIISHEIIASYPDNIYPSVISDGNKLIFEPFDFNANDDIRVKVVVSADKSQYEEKDIVKPDVRIKDLKQIRIHCAKSGDDSFKSYIGFFIAFLGLGLIYQGLFKDSSEVMAMTGSLLSVIGIIVHTSLNKKTRPYRM